MGDAHEEGKPEGTPQNEPDKPVPFFLDDHSSNIAARYWVATYNAHRVALLNTTGGSEVFPPLPLMEAAALSSLLLQTVIVPGAQTNEGTLIEAVAVPWFDIIAFLKTDPRIAFQISWEKWEEIIAGAYKKAGFDEVTLTPRSSDYGRDVIAIKKGIGSVRVIDQVKAYTPPRLVTANDVRALVGVLEMDGAARGFLSTKESYRCKSAVDTAMTKLGDNH
jgi:restriction system protein